MPSASPDEDPSRTPAADSCVQETAGPPQIPPPEVLQTVNKLTCSSCAPGPAPSEDLRAAAEPVPVANAILKRQREADDAGMSGTCAEEPKKQRNEHDEPAPARGGMPTSDAAVRPVANERIRTGYGISRCRHCGNIHHYRTKCHRVTGEREDKKHDGMPASGSTPVMHGHDEDEGHDDAGCRETKSAVGNEATESGQIDTPAWLNALRPSCTNFERDLDRNVIASNVRIDEPSSLSSSTGALRLNEVLEPQPCSVLLACPADGDADTSRGQSHNAASSGPGSSSMQDRNNATHKDAIDGEKNHDSGNAGHRKRQRADDGAKGGDTAGRKTEDPVNPRANPSGSSVAPGPGAPAPFDSPQPAAAPASARLRALKPDSDAAPAISTPSKFQAGSVGGVRLSSETDKWETMAAKTADAQMFCRAAKDAMDSGPARAGNSSTLVLAMEEDTRDVAAVSNLGRVAGKSQAEAAAVDVAIRPMSKLPKAGTGMEECVHLTVQEALSKLAVVDLKSSRISYKWDQTSTYSGRLGARVTTASCKRKSSKTGQPFSKYVWYNVLWDDHSRNQIQLTQSTCKVATCPQQEEVLSKLEPGCWCIDPETLLACYRRAIQHQQPARRRGRPVSRNVIARPSLEVQRVRTSSHDRDSKLVSQNGAFKHKLQQAGSDEGAVVSFDSPKGCQQDDGKRQREERERIEFPARFTRAWQGIEDLHADFKPSVSIFLADVDFTGGTWAHSRTMSSSGQENGDASLSIGSYGAPTKTQPRLQKNPTPGYVDVCGVLIPEVEIVGAVEKHGGVNRVKEARKWVHIARSMGIDRTDSSWKLKQAYFATTKKIKESGLTTATYLQTGGMCTKDYLQSLNYKCPMCGHDFSKFGATRNASLMRHMAKCAEGVGKGAESTAKTPYAPGDRVEGCYTGDGRWYSATIDRVCGDDLYVLAWDDGDTLDSVKSSADLRRKNPAASIYSKKESLNIMDGGQDREQKTKEERKASAKEAEEKMEISPLVAIPGFMCAEVSHIAESVQVVVSELVQRVVTDVGETWSQTTSTSGAAKLDASSNAKEGGGAEVEAKPTSQSSFDDKQEMALSTKIAQAMSTTDIVSSTWAGQEIASRGKMDGEFQSASSLQSDDGVPPSVQTAHALKQTQVEGTRNGERTDTEAMDIGKMESTGANSKTLATGYGKAGADPGKTVTSGDIDTTEASASIISSSVLSRSPNDNRIRQPVFSGINLGVGSSISSRFRASLKVQEPHKSLVHQTKTIKSGIIEEVGKPVSADESSEGHIEDMFVLADHEGLGEGFECEACGQGDGTVHRCKSCGGKIHLKCYLAPANHVRTKFETMSQAICLSGFTCEACINDLDREHRVCVMCPQGREGVMKRTNDGRWIHAACALNCPGAVFDDILGVAVNKVMCIVYAMNGALGPRSASITASTSICHCFGCSSCFGTY